MSEGMQDGITIAVASSGMYTLDILFDDVMYETELDAIIKILNLVKEQKLLLSTNPGHDPDLGEPV